MTTKTTPWKENKIISIETRKGTYVIAQMLKSPYLRFYNAFRQDENWDRIDLSTTNTLFVNAVTKQFLQLSRISHVKNVQPVIGRNESKYWIKVKNGNRMIKIWEGTPNEKRFIDLGEEPGGQLVEIDIWKSGIRSHPSGVIDAMIKENISLNENEIIDKYELTGLGVYPSLNERLFLCYKFGRNVDPMKDITFNRNIPLDYKVIVDIMAASTKEEQDKILDTYFR